MQVTANSTALDAVTAASTNPNITPTPVKGLGQDDFLKLLAAQLAAQDPMAPTDNTQFISQMANFSSLQQMSSLNSSFTAYANNQQAGSAPQYLGKQVTVTDPFGQPVTGLATAYHVQDGAVTLSINGQDYPLSSITAVSLPSNS